MVIIKNNSGNIVKDATGRVLKTRTVNENLLTQGLIGLFDADNVNNVGGYCQAMYNQALPEIADINITHAATSTGFIQIIVGVTTYNVPVTNGDAINTIASNLRAYIFSNISTSGTTSHCILSKINIALEANTTFNANGTGVSATVTITQGYNFIQNTVIYQLLVRPNVLNSRTVLGQNTSTAQGMTLNTSVFTIRQMFLVLGKSVLNDSAFGFGASYQSHLGGDDVGHIALYNFTIYNYYKNNKLYTGVTTSANPFIITSDLSLATVNNSGWILGSYYTASISKPMYVAAVAFYNRVLSVEEIAYNMRVYGSKYNIAMEA